MESSHPQPHTDVNPQLRKIIKMVDEYHFTERADGVSMRENRREI
jgi:hypothetical protein